MRADNGRESFIIGKAAAQGRALYQSARIHAFWMDEEHPRAIWDEVQPRLVRHGGVTISTMTPLLGMTWVHDDHYEPWNRGQKPNTFCSHAGMADNPSIPDEEVEAMERKYAGDPAQLAARKHGYFTRPAGLAINLEPNRHLQTWTQAALDMVLGSQEVDAVLRRRFRVVALRFRPPGRRPREAQPRHRRVLQPVRGP